jgi:hypothetical protein
VGGGKWGVLLLLGNFRDRRREQPGLEPVDGSNNREVQEAVTHNQQKKQKRRKKDPPGRLPERGDRRKIRSTMLTMQVWDRREPNSCTIRTMKLLNGLWGLDGERKEADRQVHH